MPKIMVEVDKDRSKHGIYERYSTKQKYEAVVLYRMVGNVPVIAKQMGIPEHTIYNWKVQDWWKEIEEQIRQESRAKLGKNLQNLVDRAFKAVEDRLENGDYIYDQKMGKLVRKPINANVAAGILRDSIDKSFFLEKLQKEDKKEVNAEQVSETLLKLAKEFEKFTKMKTIEVEPCLLENDTEKTLNTTTDSIMSGLPEIEKQTDSTKENAI